jgi:hypothetical protein
MENEKIKFYTDPIIVIIATSMSRTESLINRSLKSVYEQIDINPHQIYVVDDNPVQSGNNNSDEYPKIKGEIRDLRRTFLKPRFEKYKAEKKYFDMEFDNFFHTTIIPNTRTKGFSGTGAWNSAAFKSLNFTHRTYFLAFLDDDDSWDNSYLIKNYSNVRQIRKKNIKGKLKDIKPIACFTGIKRIEKNRILEIQPTSEEFTIKQFFIGNKGLQGSNLFIEQKTFWAIGAFDESMKSATDRDLAIRLIQYANLRPSKEIRFINETLVNHFADGDIRVTTNQQNKHEGLNLFYRKYLHQFDAKTQQKSLERAKKLFNYQLPDSIYSELDDFKIPTESEPKKNQIKLIVGTISDNQNNLLAFLKSYNELFSKHGDYVSDYIIIVLDNSKDEFTLRPIIEYFINNKNLKIEIISNPNDDKSIAASRTFIQKMIFERGTEYFNGKFISWIIDDDCLFKFDKSEYDCLPNYFGWLSDYQTKGVDALLGLVSDAPPLPFLSTLRTQLIDFYYNLSYFKGCNPNEKFALNNLQVINNLYEEFYYDFSNKNFQHLEYPIYNGQTGVNNLECFISFLKNSFLLSKGVNAFRRITYNEYDIGLIKNESIHRGGNTIIFNSEMLKVPNFTLEDGYNRRSDFNWAIINKYIFGRKIHEVILPLKHDRHLQITDLITNKDKLHKDIKGLIFYRFLEHLLSKENWDTQNKFKNDIEFFESIKKNVFRKIKVNNYRTLVLIYQILHTLKDVKYWWFDNKYRKEVNYFVQQNIFVMEVLRVELGKRKFQIFIEEIENDMIMNEKFINNVINKIKENVNH